MSHFMSKVKTAFSLIGRPSKMLLPAGRNGLLNFVPDKIYLKAVFRAETGYALDLEHPKTYNEKLQWIKLYDRKPEYTMYADKYRVREYISEVLGEEYLVPLIGVYDNADEIDWDDLPGKFVLKCNHASGTNIICRDKSKLDRDEAAKKLNRWLKTNAFWPGREWCYKNIEPKIICEQLIETPDGNTPDDYKFMCFNGEPKLIQLHHDRFGSHTLDYYTPEWEKTTLKRVDEDVSEYAAPRPEGLDKMLEFAALLSKKMYFARIDFYNVGQQIYFGEITLYPTSGFSTFADRSDDLRLGRWIHLT